MAVAILSFLLLLVAAYLIARPLFAPEYPEAEEDASELQEEKEKLLTEIRELDTDFASGKLADDDYRKLRARSLAEAAGVMQAIAESEDVAREAEGVAPVPPAGEGVVAAPVPVLGAADGDGRTTLDDELEREIAARKRVLEEHECLGCGAVYDPQDRFCRRCGARLAVAETG